MLVRAAAIAILATALASSGARADDSKLALEGVTVAPRAPMVGKDKRCCGYPIVPELEWALRFYWLAREDDFDEPDEIDYADGARIARTFETATAPAFVAETGR